MAVDSCFWTVQAENFQENILGGVILVYNRYSEQSVCNLTKRRTLPPWNFQENILGGVILVYNRYSEQSVCNLTKRRTLPPSKMDVTSSLATRNADCIPLIEIKRNFFKNNFFPSTIIEWNKLDAAIGNAESLDIFKNNILKFFRPTPRSFFNYYSHKGIRLMSRPLGEWVVYVNINSITIFKTVLIPFDVVVCISNQRLTFSPLFDDKRITLLNTLNKIDCKLIVAMESSLIETLLFGIHCLIWKKNSLILSYASIDYILSTKRFEEALL